MATTAIADEIEAITGVGTADASFLVSAQKFVVSSIPKNLLKWASSLTDPSSHGGNTSQGVNIVMPTATDSILDVSRNGFSAEEVPYSMKGFIANSASLHLATSTYPKYYLDNAVTDKGVIVSVKPVPTDSETANDKWEVDSGASIFADEDTFTSANSQLTRVKDAVDKVSSLIEADKPASGYDAHDLLAAEDIELLNGNLSIVKSELERAQVHLAEWVAIGDMTAKQVSSNIAEAQGYAAEIASRISQQQTFLAEANKYYQWAKEELQTYVGMNEKSIRYQSQQQQQAQAAASQ